jgi:2-polyprenyl-3-methyl-5-hydroxy-6-metoxy-1,4-benzoquinol methylase
MKERFFEPFLRKIRINKVLPIIYCYPDCRLLDIGCGWNYSLLKTVEPFVSIGVGIDSKVAEAQSPKIQTIKMTLTDFLPFESSTFDVITMMAVLEHLSDPLHMILETERVLKRGGRLVLTVPSKVAKPLLEFLAFRLHLISEVEIRDHKQYFNLVDLNKLFSQSGMIIENHNYFQMCMNNFLVAHKNVTMEILSPKK